MIQENKSTFVSKDKQKNKGHKHSVAAYPTKAGNPCKDEKHIKFDDECRDKAVAISNALSQLENQGQKLNRKQKENSKEEEEKETSYTGYMIGVGRTINGDFLGSISGKLPDTITSEEMSKIMQSAGVKYIKGNVPINIANFYLKNGYSSKNSRGKTTEDTVKLDTVQGRDQVKSKKEEGGLSGLCAAPKLLFFTTVKIEGIAEILHSPDGNPRVAVIDVDREKKWYGHQEVVPSCITCRYSLPYYISDNRKEIPKPVIEFKEFEFEGELKKLFTAKNVYKNSMAEAVIAINDNLKQIISDFDKLIQLDNYDYNIIAGLFSEYSSELYSFSQKVSGPTLHEKTAIGCLSNILGLVQNINKEITHQINSDVTNTLLGDADIDDGNGSFLTKEDLPDVVLKLKLPANLVSRTLMISANKEGYIITDTEGDFEYELDDNGLKLVYESPK